MQRGFRETIENLDATQQPQAAVRGLSQRDQERFAHSLLRKLCGTPQLVLHILIVLLAFGALQAAAQNNKPPLPQVLVISDSIYREHARGATAELKGKANVVFANWPKNTVGNSSTVLEHLDYVLGRFDRHGNPVPENRWPVWDLIHVNVGLGDLIHIFPNMKSHRVLPIHLGGIPATDPKKYEANLNEMIKQLKEQAPGAKLIWASTTPIRHSRSNVFRMGSEIEYNEIAERVMNKHRVPINDMYTYVKSIINMDKPAAHGADPFRFEKKPIHEPVVEVISRELGIPLEPKPKDEKVALK